MTFHPELSHRRSRSDELRDTFDVRRALYLRVTIIIAVKDAHVLRTHAVEEER
jgi:hypothetical protein